MTRLRSLFAKQDGFTLIAVVTGMALISLFTLGAYQAALGDISVGRKDQDRKRALEAAKAGIEWYSYHLYRDANYWSYCDDATKVATPGISLYGANRPSSAWRTLPNSDEKFQVELMTADGTPMTQSECLANPGQEMLNGGVLRIRSTGVARGKTRQLVATFRRNTFLDYLWYTNWEAMPPPQQPNPSTAGTVCNKVRAQRSSSSCTPISFGTGDLTLGPMHTEDDSWLGCVPTFGRNAADNIEVARGSSPTTVFQSSCGSSSPNLQGTMVAPAKNLSLPPSNSQLQNAAAPVLTGQSCVIFNGDGTATLRQGMTWNDTIDCTTGGTVSTITLGANTVIYAKNGTGTCPAYSLPQRYPNGNSACGDIAVEGTYTTNVTIGAQDDIVIVGDTERSTTGSPMLGLVANNYVRIYHPAYDSSGNCQSGSGGRANQAQMNSVDAAILAVNGSFLVDNYDCGGSLGNLNVDGNIAQYWRGAVKNGSSGYVKNYTYDDRLKYRQPPSYLDPLQAAWHVLRQSEQTPVQ